MRNLFRLAVPCLALHLAASSSAQDKPRSFHEVDLQAYSGSWYEIARIPNRFQRACERDVTAEYTIREDGGIEVVNRCLKADGEVSEVSGRARVKNAPWNSRLEVSFVRLLGMRLFWADYWILDVGPDYRWALAGDPEGKYGWILSRTPRLDPETLKGILERVRDHGYDPTDFTLTRQTG